MACQIKVKQKASIHITLILRHRAMISSGYAQIRKKIQFKVTCGSDLHMSQVWINLNRATFAFSSSLSSLLFPMAWNVKKYFTILYFTTSQILLEF